MAGLFIIVIALTWSMLAVGCWLGWQLLRQNGRILLRLDELESRFDELELGEPAEPERSNDHPHANVIQGTGEARVRCAEEQIRPVQTVSRTPHCAGQTMA